MILGQAVVGSQNKCLGIADHNMQPVEHTAVWVIGFMLVDVILKRRDITAVTVAADGAAGCNGTAGKLSHGRLLDILCHAHFEVLRIAMPIQGQGRRRQTPRHQTANALHPAAPWRIGCAGA